MKIEVKVPSVGESITEADLGSWEKQSGDVVKKGDVLVILETDKASQEIPAATQGTLKILKASGEKVSVGETIAFIDTSSQDKSTQTTQTEPTQSGVLNNSTQDLKTTQTNSNSALNNSSLAQESLSPSVRRLVEVNNLNPSQIKGTGRGGRLTKQDILSALKEGDSLKSSGDFIQQKDSLKSEEDFIQKTSPNQSLSMDPIEDKKALQSVKTQGSVLRKGQRREAMTRLRRITAEKLTHSQQSTATLSTFNEVDLSRIVEIRKNHQQQFVKKHGFKLGFMSFFVKAVIVALKEYPRINAFIEGEDIIYNDQQHIGIAVSSSKGLVVPVIFNAERLNLVEIEQKILDYKDKALSKKLKPDELLGGTFTISNGGVFGSLLSTPILNPPQSGILGMHKIEERPVVKKGQIVIRPMMYLTLSYDHRIVDGRESVGFLVKVKEGLEEPARLLIDL